MPWHGTRCVGELTPAAPPSRRHRRTPGWLATSVLIGTIVAFVIPFGVTSAPSSSGEKLIASWSSSYETQVLQETTPLATYAGPWSPQQDGRFLASSAATSTQPDATVSFTFTGSGVSWIGPKGPNQGTAQVYVDGRYVRRADSFSRTFSASESLFDTTFPTVSQHTLLIRVAWSRTKQAVAVDAFVVRGAKLTSAAAPTLTPTPTPAAAPTPTQEDPLAVSNPSVTVALLVQGDSTHNAKWTVTVVAGGGTFILSTFWAPGLEFAWDVSGAQMETQLEAAFDNGDTTNVTRAGNVYTIEFIGTFGLMDIQHVTVQSIAGLLPAPDQVLVGAGDITNCNDSGGATAALIGTLPTATVQTLGDNEQAGAPTLALYQQCFGPTWGQYLNRLHPAEGNHDGASGGAYFTYFGSAAGDPARGYYSYDIGTIWHIVVLNSECPGGCGVGSPQELWLKADLAAHAGMRTGAIWHKPLFSSGSLHGNDSTTYAFWQDLYAARACFVLNGHDHNYERFAPQNASGVADARGPVEFVVGTGGYGQRPLGTVRANSVVRHTGTFGVLKLTLHASGFDFAFLPVAGQTWTDTGSALCGG